MMAAGHELQAMYALWLREMKVFLREWSRIVSSILTPIGFVFFIGAGFGATTTFVDARYRGFSYEQFMFPGIVAMGVLFGTVFYGLNIIWDKKLDVLKEVLVAPVTRTTIFFGKVLGGSTQAVAQSVLLLILGVLIFGNSIAGSVLALVFVLLLALLFVSIGLFLGSFFTSFEGFQFIVGFLVFPLTFLSGAFYPIENLPPWLSFATRVNPVSYAVDGLRGALLGPHAFAFTTDVAVLAVVGGAFVIAGTWAFQRMT